MKFVPRDLGAAAEASSGGGERSLVREAAIVIGAFLALACATYFAIGWVVERTLPLISIEREQEWFASFTPTAALAEADLSPALQKRRERAAELLRQLANDSAVPRLPYRLHVVAGAEPNAFAFPGGAVGVSRGLLEQVDDDIALAFVLAHELGHFAQRDHLRGIGRALGRSLVWALLFGNGSDSLNANLSSLLDLAHSRTQESGADEFGLALVHRALGTTTGADGLFAWLEQRERLPGWTAMLLTHPQSKERLAALRAHAAKLVSSERPADRAAAK